MGKHQKHFLKKEEKLAIIKKLRHLSQKEAAKRIGIGERQLRRWFKEVQEDLGVRQWRERTDVYREEMKRKEANKRLANKIGNVADMAVLESHLASSNNQTSTSPNTFPLSPPIHSNPSSVSPYINHDRNLKSGHALVPRNPTQHPPQYPQYSTAYSSAKLFPQASRDSRQSFFYPTFQPTATANENFDRIPDEDLVLNVQQQKYDPEDMLLNIINIVNEPIHLKVTPCPIIKNPGFPVTCNSVQQKIIHYLKHFYESKGELEIGNKNLHFKKYKSIIHIRSLNFIPMEDRLSTNLHFLVDKEATVLAANDGARTLFGMSPDPFSRAGVLNSSYNIVAGALAHSPTVPALERFKAMWAMTERNGGSFQTHHFLVNQASKTMERHLVQLKFITYNKTKLISFKSLHHSVIEKDHSKEFKKIVAYNQAVAAQHPNVMAS